MWTSLSDAGAKTTHYALKQFSSTWLLMSCPYQTREAVCNELSAAVLRLQMALVKANKIRITCATHAAKGGTSVKAVCLRPSETLGVIKILVVCSSKT